MLREACRQGRRWHDAGYPVVVAVIAEGAETAEQLHYLRQHGCDEYQGFYAAQAVPKSV